MKYKKTEEKEIIIYGLKIMGSNFLTIFLIIILSLYIKQFEISIIYLSVLILLRRNTGGYHAKTYMGCLLTTVTGFVMIAFLNNKLNQDFKIIIGTSFLIYSILKIYITRPQVNKNKFVKEETIVKSNKRKNKWLIIFALLSCISYILVEINIIANYKYFFSINSSLMLIAISMKNISLVGGEKHEKNYESWNEKYRKFSEKSC